MCCTNKKQYNINELTILVSNPSKPNSAYYDTISTYEFFDAMLRPPKQTNLLLNSWLTYAHFPIPNQFGSLTVNFPNKSSLHESEYLFMEKSTNKVISGNVIFNYFNFNLRVNIFEGETIFVGYVENGKMQGKWKIPLQIAAITTYRDYLPSSPGMFENFPIGLITINYKNGMRHGQTSITDVKGYEFYTCNYYQGKLHGNEKLNTASAENTYIAYSGAGGGVWSLSNYDQHWTARYFPKQTIRYRDGEVVEMKTWIYDLFQIEPCISSVNFQDLNVTSISNYQPENFEELKKLHILKKTKYDVFKHCVKLNLILNWNTDSKNPLKDAIIQSFSAKK